MSEIAEKNFQVPNLTRGLQILEYLRHCDEPVSMSALARELDYPLNSVMRIMKALDHYGYVQRAVGSKSYEMSDKLMHLARSQASQKNLFEASMGAMRQIRDHVGETVVLSIVSEGEGLILEQVQGLHAFRFVCEPGTRQMIHSSASTKAILAFRKEHEVDELLQRIDYPKLTEQTILSAEAMKRELEQVREQGYALDRAEALEGVNCVAVPIMDSSREARAAITVTGPANRLKLDQLDEVGEMMKVVCSQVSENLGYL
ncbi:IclR family transcriptional regulator [Persicirhabdus sediminis]|uniref:IclR family transcriptional regulator n=2 Tax=Persicirhabdus sediminis TaxID=454144 RepID=A0A8J7SKZ2_9BACT|nr:IclR family transcriptional regulator [Persicirhabdus sediminis]